MGMLNPEQVFAHYGIYHLPEGIRGPWEREDGGMTFENQVLLLTRQTALSPVQGMGKEGKGVEVVTLRRRQ